jgi:hypothetical protein
MRRVFLKALMGIMLFCSVESSVDAHEWVDHHDDHPHHLPSLDPDPADQDGEHDCQQICHCAAHMPSIATGSQSLSACSTARVPDAALIVSYLSRTLAPPLRPPNG